MQTTPRPAVPGADRPLWSRPRLLLFTMLAALTALSLVLAPAARACSCVGYEFDEAVEASDLIAEVTVLEALHVDGDRVTYFASVERVWKGEEARAIELTTSEQTTACGLGEIPAGTEMVLWGSGSGGEYSTTWCALPMGEDTGPERLTAELGDPVDLSDQPVPPAPDGTIPFGGAPISIVVGVAALALIAVGAGVVGITAVAIALVLRSRRRR